jgi:hypothetical protein
VFTHIHRINHEDSGTSIEEGQCAEKIRFDSHDHRPGRRLGLQKTGGVYPHPAVGTWVVPPPLDKRTLNSEGCPASRLPL